MKIIIGLFLIAHGLVHAGLAAAPIPGDPDSNPGAFLPPLSAVGCSPNWESIHPWFNGSASD